MNVVLLTVDCLRADRVGFMGYNGGTTPFLDKLAQEGVVFENAFASGPTTTQSMPGLMTGTYPSWFGGYPPIPESQTTLAEAFSDAQFTTIGIHSNPWLHPSHQFDAGFDVYVDITEGNRQGSRPEPKDGKTSSTSSFDAVKSSLIQTLKSTYYELPSSFRRAVSQSYFTYYYLFSRSRDKAAVAVDNAIELLNKYGADNLFLWIHFMDVHRPYTLPSAGIGDGIWQTARITQPAYTNPSLEDQEYISEIYDQSVAYVDSQIKRLYREFERKNANEETLYVITSDHGEEFGEHGDWFHRNFKLYDELLHVPLLIKDPATKSKKTDRLVSLIDVAPTLLQRSGIPRDSSWTGIPQSPIVNDGSSSTREVSISEIYDPDRNKIAARTTEWKYIIDNNSDIEELYDIRADPEEENNLGGEATPSVLRDRIEEFQRKRPDATSQDIDNKTTNRLKELGYLE